MGWPYVRHDDLLLRSLHVAHYVGPMCFPDHMVPSWPHVCFFSAPMLAMGTLAAYQV